MFAKNRRKNSEALHAKAQSALHCRLAAVSEASSSLELSFKTVESGIYYLHFKQTYSSCDVEGRRICTIHLSSLPRGFNIVYRRWTGLSSPPIRNLQLLWVNSCASVMFLLRNEGKLVCAFQRCCVGVAEATFVFMYYHYASEAFCWWGLREKIKESTPYFVSKYWIYIVVVSKQNIQVLVDSHKSPLHSRPPRLLMINCRVHYVHANEHASSSVSLQFLNISCFKQVGVACRMEEVQKASVCSSGCNRGEARVRRLSGLCFPFLFPCMYAMHTSASFKTHKM